MWLATVAFYTRKHQGLPDDAAGFSTVSAVWLVVILRRLFAAQRIKSNITREKMEPVLYLLWFLFYLHAALVYEKGQANKSHAPSLELGPLTLRLLYAYSPAGAGFLFLQLHLFKGVHCVLTAEYEWRGHTSVRMLICCPATSVCQRTWRLKYADWCCYILFICCCCSMSKIWISRAKSSWSSTHK